MTEKPPAPDEVPAARRMMELLFEDISESGARRGASDTQTERRNGVRAVFAMVEGMVAFLKRDALEHVKQGLTTFTSGETAVLQETNYQLDADRVKERRMTIPLPDNVRFTLAMYGQMRTLGLPDILQDYGGPGWKAFCAAVKIRNRLTHPKVESDFVVTDEDAATISLAADWFMKAGLNAAVAVGQAVLAMPRPSPVWPPRMPAGETFWCRTCRVPQAATLVVHDVESASVLCSACGAVVATIFSRSEQAIRTGRAAFTRAVIVAAKAQLAKAHLERETERTWPSGMEWKDLVGSSHETFCRLACEAAGLSWEHVRHVLDADTLQQAAEGKLPPED